MLYKHFAEINNNTYYEYREENFLNGFEDKTKNFHNRPLHDDTLDVIKT